MCEDARAAQLVGVCMCVLRFFFLFDPESLDCTFSEFRVRLNFYSSL